MRLNIYHIARFSLIGIAACLYFHSCDKGLEPPFTPITKPHGLSGTITFRHWPSQDSVIDLRVVAFKHYPPQDIFIEVAQGNAKYTESLASSYGDSVVTYTLLLSPLPAGRYEYVIVAQQYGRNVLSDWHAVGVYYANGDTTQPGVVIVPENTIIEGINIHVDFQNIPPQP